MISPQFQRPLDTLARPSWPKGCCWWMPRAPSDRLKGNVLARWCRWDCRCGARSFGVRIAVKNGNGQRENHGVQRENQYFWKDNHGLHSENHGFGKENHGFQWEHDDLYDDFLKIIASIWKWLCYLGYHGNDMLRDGSNISNLSQNPIFCGRCISLIPIYCVI